MAADGRRLDRHGAPRIVRRAAHRAGITKPVGLHTLGHAFITAALDAGVPIPAPPSDTAALAGSLDRHAT